MAEVIVLTEWHGAASGTGMGARPAGMRHGPSARTHARPAFFFDLSCPFSYLAAERIERILGEVDWVPVPASALSGAVPPVEPTQLRVAAERRARGLRLPIVWPDDHPAPVPTAMRAADHAAQAGSGAAFAIVAMRMAFCGGYDLEDPGVLRQAAAAAGLPPAEITAAAADASRDQRLYAAANALRTRGVRSLPVIWVAGAFRDAEAVFAERLLARPA